MNSFHKSLNFTFDSFPGEVHFVDIKTDKTKTDIYHKGTHTGQYVHFTGFEPWYRKIAWVKSLIERGERICSNKHLFEKQILIIKSIIYVLEWLSNLCMQFCIENAYREKEKLNRVFFYFGRRRNCQIWLKGPIYWFDR